MSNDHQTSISKRNWPVCLWPGFARLWYRGDISSLVTAIGFGLLLNLALMSTFLWTSWPGEGFPVIIWPIVGFVWFGSAFITFFQLERIVQPRKGKRESQDTLLIRAQTEYLKGNWSEVQTLISTRLKQEPRDVPARLLLASLFRQTGSLEQAIRQLDILSRFDESVAWQFEIAHERDLIHQIAPKNEPISSDPDDLSVNNLNNKTVKTSVELIDDDDLDELRPKAA